MRPIDADALLKRINYKAESGMGKTIAFTFKHFIDDAPTIETHGDLISRAEARKAFARINDLRALSLGKVGEVLDSLPSADAEQGEWIVTEHCTNAYGFRKWIEIECPFCGDKPTYEDLDNMNFCPNCGARMTPYKGGDDE